MNYELKPCPFCGGEAEYKEISGDYQNVVRCKNFECGGFDGVWGSWLEDPTTIPRWNTRLAVTKNIMTKIYIVTAVSMEPYSDYGDYPTKAFTSKEAAEKFVKENDQVYGAGYFKWDESTDTDIPCDETDEDALYEYGWKYSSLIQEIELVEDV